MKNFDGWMNIWFDYYDILRNSKDVASIPYIINYVINSSNFFYQSVPLTIELL